MALAADRRARRDGGRLVVVARRSTLPRAFTLGRLDRRLEIVEQYPGMGAEDGQP